MAARPKINKLDAVVSQLEAATYLMLREFRPEPVHTLIWASRSVLWDLHKVRPNPILAQMNEGIDRLVKPGFKKEWNRYEVRAANFLKHADRDPDDVLEGIDIAAVNLVELAVCIIAVRQYMDQLPASLTIGLSYVGFISGDWFDFKGLFVSATEKPKEYEKYREMSADERRKFMLSAFEYLRGPS